MKNWDGKGKRTGVEHPECMLKRWDETKAMAMGVNNEEKPHFGAIFLAFWTNL